MDSGIKSTQLDKIHSDAGRAGQRLLNLCPFSFEAVEPQCYQDIHLSEVRLKSHQTTVQTVSVQVSNGPMLKALFSSSFFICWWAVLSTALHKKTQFTSCPKTDAWLNPSQVWMKTKTKQSAGNFSRWWKQPNLRGGIALFIFHCQSQQRSG